MTIHEPSEADMRRDLEFDYAHATCVGLDKPLIYDVAECAIRRSYYAEEQNKKLMGLLQEVNDVIVIPEARCSCHIAPPCNDCVEWSAARELMAEIAKVLKS